MAHYRTIVTWERFTIEISILYLAMIIVGGLGAISGSFFGAAFILLLPAMINTIGRALQGVTPAVAAVLPAVQQARVRHRHHPLPGLGAAGPGRTLAQRQGLLPGLAVLVLGRCLS